MKSITILGSSGSIGTNTLDVVRHMREEISVSALAVHSNIDRLEQQIFEFSPKVVAVFDEASAKKLRERIPTIPCLSGMEGLLEVSTLSEVDLVVAAMSGTLGLEPTVSAIRKGKDIALANKEVLVSGGDLVTSLAKEKGVSILPVDSEHSAIFQCLNGEKKKQVRRIILTASGGPFREKKPEELKTVSIDEALSHPTWNMGPKVTIDSSTLMNKGLELIEAFWLFGLPKEQISVVVHPQSIVHSMVEFCDYSIIAQLGDPDMRMPIQYALTYPDRKGSHLKPFDFTKEQTLQFFPPDIKKFPCLRLAHESIGVGKSMPCYMNAANDVLVSRFLNQEFGWSDIAVKLESLMQKHEPKSLESVEEIRHLDRIARKDACSI